MHVVMINSAKGWGGGETHVFDLSFELMKSGIRVTIACRKNSMLHKRAVEAQIPCLALPFLNALDAYTAWKLSSYAVANQVTVFHAHLARDYWIAAMAVLYKPEIKLLCTRHVLFPLGNSFFHKALFNRVNKIICVSNAVQAVVSKIIPSSKCIVIPNAVKFYSVFESETEGVKQTMGLAQDAVCIGIFGSIEPIKGQVDFIEMAKLVSMDIPHAHFFIVGQEKNQEYADNMKTLITQYNLQQQLTLTGHRTDVPLLMRTMDIVVSAAQLDAFGLVLIEAMSQKRAVVSYATAGAIEIIGHSNAALLVPIGNWEQMAKQIIELARNTGLREQVGSAGYSHVKLNYELSKMTERLIEEYTIK